MIIIDVNVLIYAVNSAASQHQTVRDWWHRAINGDEPIGLPWIVIDGFLRLTTRSGILPRPLPIETGLSLVEDWMGLDIVMRPKESADHWAIFRRLISGAGTGGNLVTDAHLAALAIGNGASLVSCDRDFSRFAGLSWISPLDEAE